jgi:hypothetical protein
MAKVPAYYTDSEEYPPTHRDVYHNDDKCPYGKEIEDADREDGTGGRDLCEKCEELP